MPSSLRFVQAVVADLRGAVVGAPDLPVRREDAHDFVGMLAEQKGFERTARLPDFPPPGRAGWIGYCQLKSGVGAIFRLRTGTPQR